MTVRRGLAGIAATVCCLPLLTSCGHGGSYCSAVKDQQADLGSLAHGGNRAALIQALPIFEDLQGRSPDDVADDWQLLVTRIQALQTALRHAGVNPSTYDARHPPAGVTREERTLIRRAAAELAASDTQQAFEAVQQEVLDVCHTPLGL
jgi:hypothetical protein